MDSPQTPIPSAGWCLRHVEDLGRAAHECVYCHNERVRYVHVIRHPAYGSLRVGCVCAEKLTGDSTLPRATENEARNRAQRFATWCAEEHWTIEEDRHTRSGRHVHWDYVITVFLAESGWKWMILFSDRQFTSDDSFPTAQDAKRHFYLSQLE